jgi:pyrrolidone-carboxylate peptidase
LILLTGFGPFSNFSVNLSEILCRKVKQEELINSKKIKIKILPVSWERSLKLYKNILTSIKSNLSTVIQLGIHEKHHISLERFALNFSWGIDIDNRVRISPIKLGFPILQETIFPLNKLFSYVKEETNIRISYFPGSYLCNYLYFWGITLSNKEYPVIFIHLPANGDIDEYYNKLILIIKSISLFV